MIGYAESSAVLSWLLGETRGEEVRAVLSEVETVVSSDLTLIECDRVLIRAMTMGATSEAAAADRRGALARVAQHWTIFHQSPQIVQRARQPFPVEPIRTVDALHLSYALAARSAMAGVALVSLDDRIRESGRQLGFDVVL